MWEPSQKALCWGIIVLFFFLVFALQTPLFLPSGYCTLKCDVSCIECSDSRYLTVPKCLVFSKPSRQTPHWITGDSFKCMPPIHSHTNSCMKSGRFLALCAEKHCIYSTSLTTVVLKVESREPSRFPRKVPNVQSCFWGWYRQDWIIQDWLLGICKTCRGFYYCVNKRVTPPGRNQIYCCSPVQCAAQRQARLSYQDSVSSQSVGRFSSRVQSPLSI